MPNTPVFDPSKFTEIPQPKAPAPTPSAMPAPTSSATPEPDNLPPIAPPPSPSPSAASATSGPTPLLDPNMFKEMPTQPAQAPARAAATRAAAPAPAAAPADGMTPERKAAKDFAAKVLGMGQSQFQQQTEASFGFGLGEHVGPAEFALLTGITNSIDELRGLKPKFGMEDAYHGAMAAQEERLAKYGQEHPILSMGAGVLGTAMTPGSSTGVGYVRAGTGLWKLGRAGLVGGAMSIPQSFLAGDHDIGDRISNVLWGVPLGTAMSMLGEGAPVGGRVLAKGGKNIAEQLGTTFRNTLTYLSGKSPEEMIRSMTPQQIKQWEDKAVEFIKLQMRRQGYDPARLSQNAAHMMGQAVTGAEAWGRYGKNLLTWLGKRAGTTPEELESTLRLRSKAIPQEVADEISKLTGLDPAAVKGDHIAHVKNLRDKAGPLYQQAEREPVPDLQKEHKLREILTRDAGQKMLKKAREIASNKGDHAQAAAIDKLIEQSQQEGFGAKKPPVYRDEKGRIKGRTSNVDWPTWEYIKQGISGVINDAKELGKRPGFAESAMMDVEQDLRNELYRINPKLEHAAAHGGEPILQEKAFDASPDLMWNTKHTEQDHRNYIFGNAKLGIKGLTPAQWEAHIGGWVNDVFQKLRKGSLKMKDLENDLFRSKIAIEIGPQKAEQFVNAIRQMQERLAFAKRAMPGSQSITSEMTEAGKDFESTRAEIFKRAAENVRHGKGVIGTGLGLLYDIGAKGASLAATTGEQEMRNALGKLLLMSPEKLQARLAEMPTAPTKGPGMAQRVLQQLDQSVPHVSQALRTAAKSAKQAGSSVEAAIQKTLQRFPEAQKVLNALGGAPSADVLQRAQQRIGSPRIPAGPDPKLDMLRSTLGLGLGRTGARMPSQSDEQAPQQ